RSGKSAIDKCRARPLSPSPDKAGKLQRSSPLSFSEIHEAFEGQPGEKVPSPDEELRRSGRWPASEWTHYYKLASHRVPCDGTSRDFSPDTPRKSIECVTDFSLFLQDSQHFLRLQRQLGPATLSTFSFCFFLMKLGLVASKATQHELGTRCIQKRRRV
ncbi:hypothetical protein CSUI_006630, partial [Cystoisospora suis]